MRGAKVALRRGQRNAESLMVDHVVVTRVVETKDAAGYEVDDERPVWSGPCKVQSYEPDSVLYVSAGRPVETQEHRLHVPVDAGPFQMGDIAAVEGYPRRFRISGLFEKTFATAQRLKIQAIANAPEEGEG